MTNSPRYSAYIAFAVTGPVHSTFTTKKSSKSLLGASAHCAALARRFLLLATARSSSRFFSSLNSTAARWRGAIRWAVCDGRGTSGVHVCVSVCEEGAGMPANVGAGFAGEPGVERYVRGRDAMRCLATRATLPPCHARLSARLAAQRPHLQPSHPPVVTARRPPPCWACRRAPPPPPPAERLSAAHRSRCCRPAHREPPAGCRR